MGVIELTGFGEPLRLVGILFWALVIVAPILAFALHKTRKGKAQELLIVAGLFAAFPGCGTWETKQQQDAARARYQKAEAMFQERCQKAGEFIYRTAENVESVFLLKDANPQMAVEAAENEYPEQVFGIINASLRGQDALPSHPAMLRGIRRTWPSSWPWGPTLDNWR
ncbi:MAG: hypothetical protein LBU46_07205 [Candidatus Accumulibacter sp.]|jgi:hypothetical protein|nr:hypothetical protein [Accumulibacter sp.]